MNEHIVRFTSELARNDVVTTRSRYYTEVFDRSFRTDVTEQTCVRKPDIFDRISSSVKRSDKPEVSLITPFVEKSEIGQRTRVHVVSEHEIAVENVFVGAPDRSLIAPHRLKIRCGGNSMSDYSRVVRIEHTFTFHRKGFLSEKFFKTFVR